MDNEKFLELMKQAKLYDLSQPTSIFTPPWPHDKSLEVHFFKRVTGAYGGGQGANGQILNWSNSVGTHLVGETAYHSGGKAISDIRLKELSGPAVVVDISDMVGDYGIYTPEMIMKKADVKEGDILIIYTGYSKYSWEKPDASEFGYLVRHPGPNMEFFEWAMKMKLKWVGVDCGCIEHPMNTPIKYWHAVDFERAKKKLKEEQGKEWGEMFPEEKYYELMHIKVPKSHLVFVESIGGDIDKVLGKRLWVAAEPIPFMETEAAWTRVAAYEPPDGMSNEEFISVMESMEQYDLTVPFSVRTPQWLNYEPLTVKFFKRVGQQQFGLGRNASICNASIHLGTHMDGEKHFYPAGRTIGQTPLDFWAGPGVIADVSGMVSDASIYTPDMIKQVVDIRKGDILIIKTGWNKFGWNSPDSDEFRYMVKHPGPSPDFYKWAIDMDIKWIAVDAVSADHPMNTIMRIWHPRTFEEANRKAKEQFGKDWDGLYPLDEFYQVMHIKLFPRHIVHAENLSGDISHLPSGRYYLGAFIARVMEAESMWGRFIAWKMK
jgi:arylformamidase